MITEEQIKNLKPGDPIFIQATFDHSDSFGDIWFAVPSAGIPGRTNFISPSRVHLTTSSQLPSVDCQLKYDPMRLFKRGDKVRVVERDGRHYDTKFDGKIWTVTANEHAHFTASRDVQVNDGCSDALRYTIPFYHLELVTPVEELSPYHVEETEREYRVTLTREERKDVIVTYNKLIYPNAKIAAESECRKLNWNWREEQNYNQN